jgi:hypothetical protein
LFIFKSPAPVRLAAVSYVVLGKKVKLKGDPASKGRARQESDYSRETLTRLIQALEPGLKVSSPRLFHSRL